ncbi:MAG: NAD(+)/NADH kinase, partial [Bacteroidota bacterium]|nr:NAD(+)/NADH kinase [Bacteroidota bacterium]
MRVTLFGRATVAQKMEQFEDVIQLLVDAGHEVLLNESLYMIQDDLQTQYNVSKINTPDDTIDYVLSLGGDGTMLEAVTWIGDKAIPILGLNFGRLGFLTDTVASFTADTVKRLQEKDLVIDERSMLLWTNPEGEPIRRFPHALNDITIQRASSSSMITI